MSQPDDWRRDHEIGQRADADATAAADAADAATLDRTRVDDVRIAAVHPLISPALLQDELPLPGPAQAL
ncbi:MAG TPA: hypothetical protein VET87_23060, partial [Rubrivivax sp.]|nr:hypothetical protein [Rubrivivax sp.]